ncbi:hypothetical protein BH23CHL4_BH23CHL4_03440 [soil metagenome]
MARVYEVKLVVMNVLRSLTTPNGPLPPGALAA